MDQEETFYQQPVDRTPYTAFVWVISIALVLTTTLGAGVWKAGSWVKSKRLLENANASGTNALLERAQNQGTSALEQARAAAEKSAQKTQEDAAAAAAQRLAEERDAAIQAGKDAAQEEIKTQANEAFQDLLQ